LRDVADISGFNNSTDDYYLCSVRHCLVCLPVTLRNLWASILQPILQPHWTTYTSDSCANISWLQFPKYDS